MRILQINAVGQHLSTGRTSKEIQEYINTKTEYECFTAFAQGVENEYSVRVGGKFGWKLHGFLSRLTGKQAYFSSHSTKKLLNYMSGIKPDGVILRNLHGNYINVPMLLKYLAKNDIATVIVLHDCWFFTGRCTHYTLDCCYKWQTGCFNCPRLKKDNPSWFFDKSKKMWREKKRMIEAIPRLATVGVSDWITKEAEKSFLSCSKEIKRIYNWIDLDSFYPKENIAEIRAKYGLQNQKIVLGVASKWSNRKGLKNFFTIVEGLSDDYAVVLLGSMAENVVLPKKVINIPQTSSVEELADAYSMADVFVTMSLEETFGKVSAESLACGTPVVCFDSTANKELVGDGCGTVIPVGDLDAMRSAIVNICEKGKDAFSENCRQFAEKEFNKAQNIADYLELFKRLIAE